MTSLCTLKEPVWCNLKWWTEETQIEKVVHLLTQGSFYSGFGDGLLHLIVSYLLSASMFGFKTDSRTGITVSNCSSILLNARQRCGVGLCVSLNLSLAEEAL